MLNIAIVNFDGEPRSSTRKLLVARNSDAFENDKSWMRWMKRVFEEPLLDATKSS